MSTSDVQQYAETVAIEKVTQVLVDSVNFRYHVDAAKVARRIVNALQAEDLLQRIDGKVE